MMSFRYKTGLKPIVITHDLIRKLRATAAHLDPLGTPPRSSLTYGEMVEKDIGDVDWLGMLGNGPDPLNPPQWSDGIGDCLIDQQFRAVLTWTALGTGPTIKGTTPQAFATYSAETGFNVNDPNSDNGTDATEGDQFFQNTGVLGQKIEASGAIMPANIVHQQWACQIFGGFEFCIDVPDFADDQFEKGEWDYTGQNYTIEGGHSIRAVQYATLPSGGVEWQIITWGKRITMTPSFAKKFVTIVRVQCCHDFVRSNGTSPANLNLAAMMAKLQQI